MEQNCIMSFLNWIFNPCHNSTKNSRKTRYVQKSYKNYHVQKNDNDDVDE